MLGEKEVLVRGREYDLLLDVGPRWDRATSIVHGNRVFPDHALPPTSDGWKIDVVVVSDDFDPALSMGRIWLPARSGRSSPLVEGERAGKPGPIALRLRLRDRHEGSVARARLSLYYETNLLQSARVVAGVGEAGTEAPQPNSVEVDYVLSGTLRNLEELATRRLGLEGEESASRSS
jgi:hypothetical protein